MLGEVFSSEDAVQVSVQKLISKNEFLKMLVWKQTCKKIGSNRASYLRIKEHSNELLVRKLTYNNFCKNTDKTRWVKRRVTKSSLNYRCRKVLSKRLQKTGETFGIAGRNREKCCMKV